jgi:N-acetylmuramoyl-L-alanine amidase
MNKLMPVCLFLFFHLNMGYKLTAGFTGNQQNNNTHIQTVVIDPGHGGKDPGAVYGNVREKDIVLDIALKLGKYIEASFPGVQVIYTRSTDVFVPLHQRAAIANKNNADLFISIHVNAVSRGNAQGTETWILGHDRSKENLDVAIKENSVIMLEADYKTTYEGFDPNSTESYIMFELAQNEYLEQSATLAKAVQDQFRERVQRIDRSVKQAGFLVLRQIAMPGILVEAGFLSHPAERKFLQSENGRDYLASAIFRAFRDYKKKIEARSSFHLVTTSPEEVPLATAVPAVTENTGNVFFSVQIASLSRNVEPVPANFKGEENIFIQKTGNGYKYFSGRHTSADKAREEQKRLRKKFTGAFIVAFNGEELIPFEKALQEL